MNIFPSPINRSDRFNKLWSALAHRVYENPIDIQCLLPAERTVFSVGLLYAEVYNGGFEQYFSNCSGAYYKDAVTGLLVLGEDRLLGVLESAAEFAFGGIEPPVDRDERERAMGRDIDEEDYDLWTDQLAKLDDLFCVTIDELKEHLVRYSIEQRLLK